MLAAVWSAKAAGLASRALGRGGGTAVSGLVALQVQPRLVEALAGGLGHGSVIVTGKNGKTTTSRLISETVRAAGLEPLANSSGSNLMRGLASTLTDASNLGGVITQGNNRLGVFEVDEAVVPQALRELRPRAAVFGNLYRDQLDRYGEVETVAGLWRQAIETTPNGTTLVLNADDPAVAALGEGRANVVYFGIDAPEVVRACLEHASDALTCTCGARYEYDAIFLAHAGHWRFPACGRARPEPAVKATVVDLRDGRSLSFRLTTPAGETVIEMALGGLYNVYNALAAAGAAVALSLPSDALSSALMSTTAAFGRQESLQVDGRRIDVFLGKNPAGLNQVLATLALDRERKTALILLNDNVADGRDISWVWDADFEVARGQFERVIVSGARAEEMALRLKYAEWDEATLAVEPDTRAALSMAIEATPAGSTLTVIPTYTAMLDVRGQLAKLAGRAPFWRS
jgi:UDP-N-acetylmuramyl tripeptide synthase